MKKSILFIGITLTSVCFATNGCINQSNALANPKSLSNNKVISFGQNFQDQINIVTDMNLIYNIDSRFTNTVTKEKLDHAESIIDILPERATKGVLAYQNMRVSILDGHKGIDEVASAHGYGDLLTDAQKELLQSTDYSTKIYIRADYTFKDEYTGAIREEYLTYFISILPDQEAEFSEGFDPLIQYLKENTKEKTAIINWNQLQPGQVSFTITKEGTVSEVKLISTSGYPTIDDLLVELIINMPEKWHPAKNAQGEKVMQELIFFFGKQGC